MKRTMKIRQLEIGNGYWSRNTRTILDILIASIPNTSILNSIAPSMNIQTYEYSISTMEVIDMEQTGTWMDQSGGYIRGLSNACKSWFHRDFVHTSVRFSHCVSVDWYEKKI